MPQNKKITSSHNQRIQSVMNLRERRIREKTNLIIVEGFREVLRAKEGKINFKELYVCPFFYHHVGTRELAEELERSHVEILEIAKEAFLKIAYGQRQEGILAVCQKPRLTFSNLRLSKKPLLVVVEGIEKPGNLGAILRSRDAAAVDGLILCDGGTDVYNPNVVRASLGTVFCVRVLESSKAQTLGFLRENRIKVYVAMPQAKTIYTNVNLNTAFTLVLGSEQKGLSDFWIKNSDLSVRIPMYGHADSLNVSSTAAILLYEAVRQRNL